MSYRYNSKGKIELWKFVFILYTGALFVLSPDNTSYGVICLLTYIDLLLGILVLWKSHNLNMGNGLFLFWIITFLFSFGQNLAYPLITDINAVKNELLYQIRYDDQQMALGSLYTLKAFNILSLALLTRGSHVSIGRFGDTIRSREREIAVSAGYVGRFFLSVGLIPQIQFIYLHLIQYLSLGYGQSAVDQMSGLFLRLHYLFIPAVIICFCSNKYLKRKTTLYSVILLAQVIFFLLMGDRGTGLTILVTILLMNAAFDENFSIKKYILPSIIIILLIPVVKYYRIFFTRGSSGGIAEAVTYSLQHNPIVDILLETGGSQKILLLTISKVKQEGFAFGKAYLDFFIKMLPSFLGISTNYGTLSKWVINTTGFQTQGYSIWGEAYLNFGQFGIFFMFFIGLIFKHLLFIDNDDSNLFQIIRASISLYFFADIARRSISEFGYNFLYDLILPLVLIYIGALIIKRRETSHGTKEEAFN